MNRTLLSVNRTRRTGPWVLAAELGLRECCRALLPILRVSAQTTRTRAVLQISTHVFGHCHETR